jgi:protein-S-isoprenylcysteine O-methyltransferase Ste14
MGQGEGDKPRLTPQGRGRLVEVAVTLVLTMVSYFAAAGRWLDGRAWSYFAAGGLYYLVVVPAVLARCPRFIEIVNARGGHGEGTKAWDKAIGGLLALMYFLLPLTAGLDARFGWSSLPVAWLAPGIALFVLSGMLAHWAMLSNPFFEKTVRIQEERGHHVATGGPYRFVRHPGYVAFILMGLALPLGVGSAWALLPAGLNAALIVLRTALEDRTLHRELPGYAEYAQRTRYRLLPGVW